MKQPERCTGVDSGGCTIREYWVDKPEPVKCSDGSYLYRNYAVISDAPPIPRGPEWSFCHEDYDGAPDASDNRCGFADSASECFFVIDEIEDE